MGCISIVHMMPGAWARARTVEHVLAQTMQQAPRQALAHSALLVRGRAGAAVQSTSAIHQLCGGLALQKAWQTWGHNESTCACPSPTRRKAQVAATRRECRASWLSVLASLPPINGKKRPLYAAGVFAVTSAARLSWLCCHASSAAFTVSAAGSFPASHNACSSEPS